MGSETRRGQGEHEGESPRVPKKQYTSAIFVKIRRRNPRVPGKRSDMKGEVEPAARSGSLEQKMEKEKVAVS